MLRYLIQNLDIYESNEGKSSFINILKQLIDLEANKSIIFQFRGEDNFFLKETELEPYRTLIPQYFEKHGSYKVVRKRDKYMFDSFGLIKNIKNDIYDFITQALKYFYGCSFFLPQSDDVWSYIIENYEEFLKNKDGVMFFHNDFTPWVFIKGMDGDVFEIVYKEDFKLPFLSTD